MALGFFCCVERFTNSFTYSNELNGEPKCAVGLKVLPEKSMKTYNIICRQVIPLCH